MSKLLVLVCAAVIGEIIGCSSKKTEGNTAADQVQNEVAYIKNSYATIDGTDIRLTDYSGKVVFISYWATWCKPCIKEMPSIEALKQQLPSDSIVFLMVSDEPIDKIKSFIQKNAFTFDFIKLEGEISRDSVYTLPTTHIYNKYGVKEHELVGARDWDSVASIDMLNGLIGAIE
jgi:thiol-disulfide isomerase/thioredoxin